MLPVGNEGFILFFEWMDIYMYIYNMYKVYVFEHNIHFFAKSKKNSQLSPVRKSTRTASHLFYSALSSCP